MTRRRLFGGAFGAVAAMSASERAGATEAAAAREFCVFTKQIQHLPHGELARTVASIGFDGVEVPLRPGGQVEPSRVEDELPQLIESLRRHGLKLSLLASGINEISEEQRTEAVLRTAKASGVTRFRLAYYRYDLARPIHPQLAEFRAKLKDLVALTDEIGIRPIYQNHSGRNYFGGPIWDLHEVVSDFDPAQVAVAFDIGHATIEGAKAWPLNFALIRPHVDMVFLKEPHWRDGKLGWAPLGEGVVDRGFYRVLRESGFEGPVSIQIEYVGDGPEKEKAVIQAMRNDLATARRLLG